MWSFAALLLPLLPLLLQVKQGGLASPSDCCCWQGCGGTGCWRAVKWPQEQHQLLLLLKPHSAPHLPLHLQLLWGLQPLKSPPELGC